MADAISGYNSHLDRTREREWILEHGMESPSHPLNKLAVGSFACALLSPLIFTVFIVVGVLQELGYVFVDSNRYQSIARVLMLVLSVAAITLSYRAMFQIAISNGFYRGTVLASTARMLGYAWGTVMLLAILLWGF